MDHISKFEGLTSLTARTRCSPKANLARLRQNNTVRLSLALSDIHVSSRVPLVRNVPHDKRTVERDRSARKQT